MAINWGAFGQGGGGQKSDDPIMDALKMAMLRQQTQGGSDNKLATLLRNQQKDSYAQGMEQFKNIHKRIGDYTSQLSDVNNVMDKEQAADIAALLEEAHGQLNAWNETYKNNPAFKSFIASNNQVIKNNQNLIENPTSEKAQTVVKDNEEVITQAVSPPQKDGGKNNNLSLDKTKPQVVKKTERQDDGSYKYYDEKGNEIKDTGDPFENAYTLDRNPVEIVDNPDYQSGQGDLANLLGVEDENIPIDPNTGLPLNKKEVGGDLTEKGQKQYNLLTGLRGEMAGNRTGGSSYGEGIGSSTFNPLETGLDNVEGMPNFDLSPTEQLSGLEAYQSKGQLDESQLQNLQNELLNVQQRENAFSQPINVGNIQKLQEGSIGNIGQGGTGSVGFLNRPPLTPGQMGSGNYIGTTPIGLGQSLKDQTKVSSQIPIDSSNKYIPDSSAAIDANKSIFEGGFPKPVQGVDIGFGQGVGGLNPANYTSGDMPSGTSIFKSAWQQDVKDRFGKEMKGVNPITEKRKQEAIENARNIPALDFGNLDFRRPPTTDIFGRPVAGSSSVGEMTQASPTTLNYNDPSLDMENQVSIPVEEQVSYGQPRNNELINNPNLQIPGMPNLNTGESVGEPADTPPITQEMIDGFNQQKLQSFENQQALEGGADPSLLNELVADQSKMNPIQNLNMNISPLQNLQSEGTTDTSFISNPNANEGVDTKDMFNMNISNIDLSNTKHPTDWMGIADSIHKHENPQDLQYNTDDGTSTGKPLNKDGTLDIGRYQINERWLKTKEDGGYSHNPQGEKDTVWHDVQKIASDKIDGWDGMPYEEKMDILSKDHDLNEKIAKHIYDKRGIGQWSSKDKVLNDLKEGQGNTKTTSNKNTKDNKGSSFMDDLINQDYQYSRY